MFVSQRVCIVFFSIYLSIICKNIPLFLYKLFFILQLFLLLFLPASSDDANDDKKY